MKTGNLKLVAMQVFEVVKEGLFCVVLQFLGVLCSSIVQMKNATHIHSRMECDVHVCMRPHLHVLLVAGL